MRVACLSLCTIRVACLSLCTMRVDCLSLCTMRVDCFCVCELGLYPRGTIALYWLEVQVSSVLINPISEGLC